MKRQEAIAIFSTLSSYSQNSKNALTDVLEGTKLNSLEKEQVTILMQFFDHLFTDNRVLQAYESYPEYYINTFFGDCIGVLNLKEVFDKCAYVYNVTLKYFNDSEEYQIALENVVSKNLLNDTFFGKQSETSTSNIQSYQSNGKSLYVNVKGRAKLIFYLGLANFILYKNDHPIGFTEEYFAGNRRFGVPNSLTFSSKGNVREDKLVLSVRNIIPDYDEYVQRLTTMIRSMKSDAKLLNRFKNDPNQVLEEYKLSLKLIDKDNAYYKSLTARADEIVLKAIKEEDVPLYLNRMNQLGMYRIGVAENGEVPALAIVFVSFVVVVAAFAVLVYVALACDFWVDPCLKERPDIGVLNGIITNETLTLEIAKEFGSKDFMLKVAKQMEKDAEALLPIYKSKGLI